MPSFVKIDIHKCEKQELDGPKYYASFSSKGVDTVAQAVFLPSDGGFLGGSDYVHQCRVRHQPADADWNFDALC